MNIYFFEDFKQSRLTISSNLDEIILSFMGSVHTLANAFRDFMVFFLSFFPGNIFNFSDSLLWRWKENWTKKQKR